MYICFYLKLQAEIQMSFYMLYVGRTSKWWILFMSNSDILNTSKSEYLLIYSMILLYIHDFFFLHFVVTPPCWSSPPSLLTPHWAPLHWFGLMTHPAAGGWVEDRWLFLWGKYFVWNWTWLLPGPPNPKFGRGFVLFFKYTWNPLEK